MGRILQELGVEEEKLILEKEAVDTTTNAHNVLKLVRDEVLVTQVVFQIEELLLEDCYIRTGGRAIGITSQKILYRRKFG